MDPYKRLYDNSKTKCFMKNTYTCVAFSVNDIYQTIPIKLFPFIFSIEFISFPSISRKYHKSINAVTKKYYENDWFS